MSAAGIRPSSLTPAREAPQVVVIVDDDTFGLALMRTLVEAVGPVEVQTFDDPSAALAWCRTHDLDVLITDYEMPEMNGLSLLRALRAHPRTRDVPMMMITALEDRDIRYKALETGANDYLTKPLDAPEVRARVRNMLAVSDGQRALQRRSDHLAREVRLATASIVEREREIVLRLSRAAEFRDVETGSHIMRIAHFSDHIARALGHGEGECEQIFLASPMHDVGKIGIPDNILLKPGRFSGEEFAMMQQHTVIGHRILSGSQSELLQLAAEIALSHHERYDGAGYPHGRQGDDIPLAGRIVAVADVFDALMSSRPYKRAWSLDEALSLIRTGREKQFDPDCVDAFMLALPQILATRDRFGEEAQSEAERSPLRAMSTQVETASTVS
ncbi:MAG: response regulator [Gemmatimonadaceae bacterium]|nr:response regulator [Gemmatimonadaceae bacterium]